MVHTGVVRHAGVLYSRYVILVSLALPFRAGIFACAPQLARVLSDPIVYMSQTGRLMAIAYMARGDQKKGFVCGFACHLSGMLALLES
jgi:hypothetical protein